MAYAERSGLAECEGRFAERRTQRNATFSRVVGWRKVVTLCIFGR
ncbi:hypothetical protein LMG31506_05862 [Cupriavidus yeoncheonensis]|uniref:Uncharacterized protein n=1 Tax=Cupriavidus yeoncheonensis TaxID=1462994 RepID=A0A916J0I9_9BURK|nr:hypothetical protein LMG31506_05862 [Cupriavidus yeoncheonensis]